MPPSFRQLERSMRKIKQRRYRAGTWREILARFEHSGLGAPAICARERISVQSLRRWQLRLSGESEHALVDKTEGLTNKTAEFIDLGADPERGTTIGRST